MENGKKGLGRLGFGVQGYIGLRANFSALIWANYSDLSSHQRVIVVFIENCARGPYPRSVCTFGFRQERCVFLMA